MIKVLHLLAYPEDVGGILPVIRDLSLLHSEAEIEHVVWVSGSFEQTRLPELDLRYTRLNARDRITFKVISTGVKDLGSLLKKEEFHILHSHDRHALLAGLVQSLIRGLPLIATAHVYSPKRFFYANLRRIPGVTPVFLTKGMAAYYRGNKSSGSVDIVPDSCSDELFTRQLPGARKEFTSERPLILLGLGLFHVWKNWHVVMDAIAMLPVDHQKCIKFVLRGKASTVASSLEYTQRLHEIVRTKHLEKSVEILPFTDQPILEIDRCDWFVMPSIMEPCSVAIGEAMALGKPVLVSRSGGNVDLVDDGLSGVMFDPCDTSEIAEKLMMILECDSRVCLDPKDIRERARFRAGSKVAALYASLYVREAS